MNLRPRSLDAQCVQGCILWSLSPGAQVLWTLLGCTSETNKYQSKGHGHTGVTVWFAQLAKEDLLWWRQMTPLTPPVRPIMHLLPRKSGFSQLLFRLSPKPWWRFSNFPVESFKGWTLGKTIVRLIFCRYLLASASALPKHWTHAKDFVFALWEGWWAGSYLCGVTAYPAWVGSRASPRCGPWVGMSPLQEEGDCCQGAQWLSGYTSRKTGFSWSNAKTSLFLSG